MADGQEWHGPPNSRYMLDTLFSAIATYSYGEIPVRFRLKPGTEVRISGEFLIQDASEIESWSFGTPEHYDEIVRDYQRNQSGKRWAG